MATMNRVFIDKEFHPIADRLVRRSVPGTTSIEGVFQNYRELAVFAAGLGYRKRREHTVKEPGREIKLDAVGRVHSGGRQFVLALAVADSKTVTVLAPDKESQKERAEIFERYMNGGLGYLDGFVREKEAGLDGIARIVKSEHSPDETREEALNLALLRLPSS